MLNNKLVIIFTRDQIIVLSQQPSFVLYSCKQSTKTYSLSIDVIEYLDYVNGVIK